MRLRPWPIALLLFTTAVVALLWTTASPEAPESTEYRDREPARQAESTLAERMPMEWSAVSGRTVSAASGRGVEGCLVSAAWLGERQALVTEAFTATDGAFVVPNPGVAPGRLVLRFVAKGHASTEMAMVIPPHGTDKRLGDILLAAGVLLRGRLVDEGGQPLSGGRLSFALSDELGATHSVTTERDGTFATKELLKPGRWSVSTSTDTLAGLSPDEVEIPAREAFDVVIVGLARASRPAIRGRVIDARTCKPLDGIAVSLIDAAAIVEPVVTEGDGTFVLHQHIRDLTRSARLDLSDRTARYARRLSSPVEWDSLAADHPMYLGGDLIVTAVSDGRPVTSFIAHRLDTISTPSGMAVAPGVSGEQLKIVSITRGGSTSAQSDATGRARFPGLVGRFMVWTNTIDGASYSNVYIVEVEPEAVKSVVCELAEAIELTVAVKDEFGRAVSDSSLELGRELVAPITPLSHAISQINLNQTEVEAWSHLGVILVDQSTRTDPTGHAKLRAPATASLKLRVLGPGHIPVVVDVVNPQSLAGTLSVTVQVHGEVTGRLVPASVLSSLREVAKLSALPSAMTEPGIRFSKSDGTACFPMDFLERVALSDDGAFSAKGLAPGKWHCQLIFTDATSNSSCSQTISIAEVVVRGGYQTLGDIDIGRSFKEPLDLMVLHEGRPWDGKVEIQELTKADEGFRLGGSFSARVAGGSLRYWRKPAYLHLAILGRDGTRIEDDETLSSERVVTSVDVLRRRLELSVTQDSAPVAEDRVRIRHAISGKAVNAPYEPRLQKWVIDPMPNGAIFVHVKREDGQDSVYGPYTVSDSQRCLSISIDSR